MNKNILLGIGAGGFSQIVTVVIQLVSVPVFLSSWSLQYYGIWLVLSSLQTYFLLSDGGLASAAGNAMTMSRQSNLIGDAARTYRALKGFLFVVGVIMTLLGSLALAGVSLLHFLPVSDDVAISTWALLGAAALAQYSSAFEQAIRSVGRLPFAITASHAMRLFEWVGYITGFLVTHSMAGVALGGLISRLASSIALGGFVQKKFPEYCGRMSFNFRRDLKGLMSPALGGFAYNLSSAITLQGTTVITAFILSPAVAAVLNTNRTVFRLIVQLAGIFSFAAWVQFSQNHAERVYSANLSLLRQLQCATLAIVGLASAGLFFFGPWLLLKWTRGFVSFDPSLSLILMTYAILASLSHSPRTLLFSINRQGRLGWILLGVSLLGLPLTLLLGVSLKLYGVAAGAALSEALAVCVIFVILSKEKSSWLKSENG